MPKRFFSHPFHDSLQVLRHIALSFCGNRGRCLNWNLIAFGQKVKNIFLLNFEIWSLKLVESWKSFDLQMLAGFSLTGKKSKYWQYLHLSKHSDSSAELYMTKERKNKFPWQILLIGWLVGWIQILKCNFVEKNSQTHTKQSLQEYVNYCQLDPGSPLVRTASRTQSHARTHKQCYQLNRCCGTKFSFKQCRW